MGQWSQLDFIESETDATHASRWRDRRTKRLRNGESRAVDATPTL